MNFPSFKWPILLIGVAFLAVAFFGFISYIKIEQVRVEEQEIARVFEIREATRGLLSSIKDAETGERGFVITGDDQYLKPYDAGLDEIEEGLQKLRLLIVDRPNQQARVDALEQLIEDRMAELKETIELRVNTENPDEAIQKVRDLIVTNTNNELMEQIRTLTKEMLEEESARLEQQKRESKNRNILTKSFILSGNLLAIALAALSGVAWRRSSKQRDQAERQLVSSEAELSAIIESATEGIIAFDHDLRIRFMNPAAEKKHRCNASKVIGTSLLNLVPERFRESVGQDISEFLQSGEPRHRFQSRIALRADQSEFPTEGVFTRSVAEGREFVTLMFRDTSDKQQIKTLLHQQGEFLDQIRYPIQVCDLQDHLVYWNAESERVFGIAAKDAVGKDVVQLIFPAYAKQWQSQRETLINQGQVACEWQLVDKDDRHLVFEHRRSLIRDQAGQPTAQLIMNVDVTARKQEELRDRRAQRLETIGTLAGGVAHDLNNVLTPILMSGKLLKRPGTDHAKLADTIVASADRGGNMIKKLLAFAGGEQGERERIDIGEIVRESEQILSHSLPKNVQLTVNCEDGLHSVLGDATEISQVLINLAINARDAVPDGGILELRAENVWVEAGQTRQSHLLEEGPYLKISISDNGTGIPAEIIDKIFDPFFTTKEQGKGTGLGLTTTLGIVRSIGGEIQVYSEVGHGTTFTIYLPACDRDSIESDSVESFVSVRGNGESILVVDDEPLILEMARTTLELSGYRVEVASCGAEAVAAYLNDPGGFDLVILDVMMPGMDGSDTKDRLRAINPDVKVIAASGLRKPGTEGSRIADVDGFLAKPYSDEQLLQMVGRVLGIPVRFLSELRSRQKT